MRHRVIVDETDQLVLKQAETGSTSPTVAVDLKCSSRRFPSAFDFRPGIAPRCAGIEVLRQLTTRRRAVEIGRRNQPGQGVLVQDCVFFTVSASALSS